MIPLRPVRCPSVHGVGIWKWQTRDAAAQPRRPPVAHSGQLPSFVWDIIISIVINIIHSVSSTAPRKNSTNNLVLDKNMLELQHLSLSLSPTLVRLRGCTDGRATAPRHPQSPQFSLTLSPPTRRSINLIANAPSGNLATDKWVSSATRLPFSCAYAHDNPHRGCALSPHHMV